MNKVKFDLVNNINEREIIMTEERLDVLDKVKDLVFMKGTEYMTTKMVAEYYNIPKGTIDSVVNRNKEELIKNGLVNMKGQELKDFKGNLQYESTLKELKFVSQVTLFTKRTILNVGMLLEESPVAEQVRTLLLDNHEQLIHIHDKLESNKEITKEDIDKSNPLYFVNREKELRQQELDLRNEITDSLISGDVANISIVMTKLSKIKEDLIALEKERNELNKPKVTYYDMVLKSKGLVSVTQIAKDYGMSGQAFNKKLHDLNIQYKQGKQWLLYSNYQDKGWTQSETYCNGDNSYITTKWTQKGRQGLYEVLKENGILPLIEQTA